MFLHLTFVRLLLSVKYFSLNAVFYYKITFIDIRTLTPDLIV